MWKWLQYVLHLLSNSNLESPFLELLMCLVLHSTSSAFNLSVLTSSVSFSALSLRTWAPCWSRHTLRGNCWSIRDNIVVYFWLSWKHLLLWALVEPGTKKEHFYVPLGGKKWSCVPWLHNFWVQNFLTVNAVLPSVLFISNSFEEHCVHLPNILYSMCVINIYHVGRYFRRGVLCENL